MAIIELILFAAIIVWAVTICARCTIVVIALAAQLPVTKCDGDVANFA